MKTGQLRRWTPWLVVLVTLALSACQTTVAPPDSSLALPDAAWNAVGEGVGNRFGYTVATVGDVNGDGYADVVVEAYGYDTWRGRATVYLGQGRGERYCVARQRWQRWTGTKARIPEQGDGGRDSGPGQWLFGAPARGLDHLPSGGRAAARAGAGIDRTAAPVAAPGRALTRSV